MANTLFIETLAKLVQKYAPQYGIKVISPIVAQGILESASGTSNKVKIVIDGKTEWRHNYFGLKWRNKRCAISNEYFEEWTAEQNPDGTYKNIVSRFFKFNSLEDCVIGYFQFTNISAYKNLKGVTDPRTYLENIKKDKYATSHNYVDNLMKVIEKYDLTKYDTIASKNTNVNENKDNGADKMVITVHAGHNPDGMKACGAIGIIKESTEARKVTSLVIDKLEDQGHTVIDATCNNGTSVKDVLNKIIAKCNAQPVTLNVSIHFNSSASKSSNGTEVLIYSNSSKAKSYANKICNNISALGFKNRGLKLRPDLSFLRKTKGPSLLIEVCFVGNAKDVQTYQSNVDAIANAIVKGITGVTPTTSSSTAVGSTSDCPFIVKCLDHLNIRETPNGKIVRANGCKKGTKYTIVKVNGNWGYLKSGAGWISISSKYVTRT